MAKKAKARKRTTKIQEILNQVQSQAFTPKQPLALCGQLEDAILLLENRISNAIAKINSLM